METAVFLITSFMLGVGLAMDAFSVSVANGLHDPHMSRRRMRVIAGTFAGFQCLMPLIGWVCVHSVVTYFNAVRPFIPWIAFLLLGFIGGKMIYEGVSARDGSEETVTRLTPHELLVQGIATSIDALSVGFTIAEYTALEALAASLIIAAVTYVLCMIGLLFGRKAGEQITGKAPILGGVILILIGLKLILFG